MAVGGEQRAVRGPEYLVDAVAEEKAAVVHRYGGLRFIDEFPVEEDDHGTGAGATRPSTSDRCAAGRRGWRVRCRAGGPRLRVHLGFEGGSGVAVEDAEGDGERRRLEAREQLGQGTIALVVDEYAFRPYAVLPYVYDFEFELVPLEAKPLLPIPAEHQRLPVLEVQLRLRGDLLGRKVVEHAVIEHDAVLEHLDERRPTVLVRALQ